MQAFLSVVAIKKMSFGSKIIKILQVFKEHLNEMYKLIAFFMYIPG